MLAVINSICLSLAGGALFFISYFNMGFWKGQALVIFALVYAIYILSNLARTIMEVVGFWRNRHKYRRAEE
jgi:hypothetical protein